MTEMEHLLPYLFGITRLLLGLFLIVKVVKWSGKEGQPTSSIWLKILAIACFVSGLYTLIFSKPNDYRLSNDRWEAGDREILMNKCLQETHEMAEKHPEIMNEYCECGVDAEMNHFSKPEYLELIKKTNEERVKVELPVFKHCLDEMQKKLHSKGED